MSHARAGPDDAALVAWAQDGREEAFEELVRRHRNQAYHTALRLLADPQLAEDAAQEALVAVWKGLPRFRADAQFATWLYRIVTNTALNAATRSREITTADLVPPATAQAVPPDLVVEGKEQIARLQAAIAALPREQRTALVLRIFEERSYEEVADILGITVPAVKGRLHRARRQLARIVLEREQLEQPHPRTGENTETNRRR